MSILSDDFTMVSQVGQIVELELLVSTVSGPVLELGSMQLEDKGSSLLGDCRFTVTRDKRYRRRDFEPENGVLFG